MRATRLSLAVTALCSALVLSACSGSDDDEAADAAGTSAPEAQADCKAEVKLSGAVKASWSGKAYVITGGGNEAFYKSTKGKKGVSILPGREGQPATPIVTAKGTTFTVQPGDGTVDVDRAGSGAEVDADAVADLKGKQAIVHVVATFKC